MGKGKLVYRCEEAFKRGVSALVVEKHIRKSQVAKQLGIASQTLRDWIGPLPFSRQGCFTTNGCTVYP